VSYRDFNGGEGNLVINNTSRRSIGRDNSQPSSCAPSCES